MKIVLAYLLLIAGGALAFVSYNYYDEYRRDLAAAELYRQNPDVHPAGETSEQSVARALRDAAYDRDRALPSGLASVVALAAAGALLFSARKSRFGRAGLEGESWVVPGEDAVRWAAAALATPLDVRMGRASNVLLALLALFFAFLDVVIISQSGISLVSAIVVGMNVVILVVIYVVVFRALRRSARRFDALGVARGDGRRFAWADFERVVYVMDVNRQTRREYLWRVEVAFVGGDAWILPTRVANLGDVMTLVDAIPGARVRRRG